MAVLSPCTRALLAPSPLSRHSPLARTSSLSVTFLFVSLLFSLLSLPSLQAVSAAWSCLSSSFSRQFVPSFLSLRQSLSPSSPSPPVRVFLGFSSLADFLSLLFLRFALFPSLRWPLSPAVFPPLCLCLIHPSRPPQSPVASLSSLSPVSFPLSVQVSAALPCFSSQLCLLLSLYVSLSFPPSPRPPFPSSFRWAPRLPLLMAPGDPTLRQPQRVGPLPCPPRGLG